MKTISQPVKKFIIVAIVFVICITAGVIATNYLEFRTYNAYRAGWIEKCLIDTKQLKGSGVGPCACMFNHHDDLKTVRDNDINTAVCLDYSN